MMKEQKKSILIIPVSSTVSSNDLLHMQSAAMIYINGTIDNVLFIICDIVASSVCVLRR